MQQHSSKYFARRTPTAPGFGSVGLNSYKNMVANSLPADPQPTAPDPGDGVKR